MHTLPAPAGENSYSAVSIDASAIPGAPEALPFGVGGRSPDGHTLGINSRYLTLDAKPWFPVMGDFHYSRYPADEWEGELLKMKAGGIRIVSTIRCEENVGMDLQSTHPEIDARLASRPCLTAEMGGGMAIAYHRRPLMHAEDVAAVDVAKLGSGVTLLGYYVFHGGTNPEGKLSTLQESQATGYPNDLPVKTYDFQAPLRKFGQMRDFFRALKTFHLFLSDFGQDLAPMTTSFPDPRPGLCFPLTE